MKPVIFHREAEAEFRISIIHYDAQREGLGQEFQQEVETAIALIAKVPQAFSAYGDGGLRKFVLKRFPFSIYYREFEEAIWIAAVAHGKRRPGYWTDRTAE